jgi:adenylate cyclase
LAARTIQQGWSAQIQTASQNGRPALGVGIGIHTGVASIGEVGKACKELAITGPVVNLAARIQGAAKGGETLVSEAAYQQAVDVAHGGEARDLAFKGIEGPTRVHAI